MQLSAEAWSLRQAAREAISRSDFSRGFDLADEAQQTQRTAEGEALLKLCEWLEKGQVAVGSN